MIKTKVFNAVDRIEYFETQRDSLFFLVNNLVVEESLVIMVLNWLFFYRLGFGTNQGNIDTIRFVDTVATAQYWYW